MATTEARYYDTNDLRLTKAGIEVRRLAADWLVSLPTGEVRFPLVDDQPERAPAELPALLVAYTAGRDLSARPVDRRAEPTEAELGRKSSMSDVLGRYLRQQLAALRVADVALRRGEPAGVHDLRVAVRRLRTCLRVFATYFQPDRLARVRAELAWLFGVLGDARDVEVLRARITGALHALPTELVLGPVPVELDRFLAKREAHTADAVHEAITGTRYVALLKLLEDVPCRPAADRRAGKALPNRIEKSFRALRAAVAETPAASGPERDAALHSVRKKTKRLRYTCEIAEPVLGTPAKRIRRECRQVQRILGEHHDSVVLRAELRRLGGQAHLAGTNGFTFGVLHGQAGEQANRNESQFARQWDRVTGAVSRAR